MKTEKERMKELVESFKNPNEVLLTSKSEIDEEKIKKENARLKVIADKKTNDFFKNENYYVAGSFRNGGNAKTVNTFLDGGGYTTTTAGQEKVVKSQPSSLKPEEALEIAIKRVIKSGAPINNISFYDEVNWNLTNLGFPAVDSIAIKTSINSMIGEQ